jgi:hypothetical protein
MVNRLLCTAYIALHFHIKTANRKANDSALVLVNLGNFNVESEVHRRFNAFSTVTNEVITRVHEHVAAKEIGFGLVAWTRLLLIRKHGRLSVSGA